MKADIMVSIRKPGDSSGQVLTYRNTGDMSDGYHTFHELYRHRYALFVALCAVISMRWLPVNIEKRAEIAWCSRLHHDETMFDDSFIVGLELPTGQVTYHLPLKEWDRVSAVLPVLPRAPKWDGHTPEEALERIEKFVYGEINKDA